MAGRTFGGISWFGDWGERYAAELESEKALVALSVDAWAW